MAARRHHQGAGLRHRLMALGLVLTLLGLGQALLAVEASAAEPGDNYPSTWRSAAQDSLVDSWGYYNRECTSWTAWALHDRNKFEMPRAIGNATVWGTWASSHGYTVNSTPAVGAVAWWSSGHVAWVSAVSGSNIAIQEYNYGYTGVYHTRTIAASSAKYIHFKDLSIVKATSPAISGVPKVGSKLSASTGSWKSVSGSSPSAALSYRYQWLANGSAISSATASTFTPTTSVAGKKISVTVTASASGYKAGTATSSQTSAVAPGSIVSTVLPAVSGVATVASPLTVSDGSWSPAPSTLTYQWFAGTTAIAGATARSFTPTPAQVGQSLSVTVTAHKSGYADSAKTATSTGSVQRATMTVISAPVIQGEPTVGQPLTVLSGSWSPAAGMTRYQWLADGTRLPGATQDTFVPSSEQVGQKITVLQTAVHEGYFDSEAESATTNPVAGAELLLPEVPVIVGDSIVGSTLTVDPGRWEPEPVELDFQWNRDGAPLPDATSRMYTLVPGDLGSAITVSVSGRKVGFLSQTVTSDATVNVQAAMLVTTPQPVIHGTAQLDELLTVDAGTWVPGGIELSYQWTRNGVAIDRATGPTYLVGVEDVGSVIGATVTGVKDGYTSVSRDSETIGPVSAGELVGAVASVVGDPLVGSSLSVRSASEWEPVGTLLTYQWNRNGAPIVGAADSTYTLTVADLGSVVTASVTGSLHGYLPRTVTSSETSTVLPGLLVSNVPDVAGAAVNDSVLSASPGSWAPTDISFSYRWLRDGVPIAGATFSTYRLTTDDVGKAVSVSVTGEKPGYMSVTETSASMGPVMSAAMTSSAPTVSGTLKQTYVLTAKPNAWTPGATLSYQWRRSGANISGATSSTYTLTSSDVGKKISVAVTGSKSGYVAATRTSAETAAISKAVFASVMARTQRQASATLSSTQSGWYEKGSSLVLQCYRRGQAVSGYYSSFVPGGKSDIWYQIKDGYYAADIDLNTGSNTPVVAAC